jgi:hypothetical protein
MKIFCKILFVLFVFIIGCSMSSVTVRENQIGNGLKPLMDKQHEDKQINVSIPLYNF